MLSAHIDARHAHAGLDRLPGAVTAALRSKQHAVTPQLRPHVLGSAIHAALGAASDTKADALHEAGGRRASLEMLPNKHQALARAVAGADRLGDAIHATGSHAQMVDRLRQDALHAARQALGR